MPFARGGQRAGDRKYADAEIIQRMQRNMQIVDRPAHGKGLNPRRVGRKMCKSPPQGENGELSRRCSFNY